MCLPQPAQAVAGGEGGDSEVGGELGAPTASGMKEGGPKAGEPRRVPIPRPSPGFSLTGNALGNKLHTLGISGHCKDQTAAPSVKVG